MSAQYNGRTQGPPLRSNIFTEQKFCDLKFTTGCRRGVLVERGVVDDGALERRGAAVVVELYHIRSD